MTGSTGDPPFESKVTVNCNWTTSHLATNVISSVIAVLKSNLTSPKYQPKKTDPDFVKLALGRETFPPFSITTGSIEATSAASNVTVTVTVFGKTVTLTSYLFLPIVA